jgi:hypothetical protein
MMVVLVLVLVVMLLVLVLVLVVMLLEAMPSSRWTRFHPGSRPVSHRVSQIQHRKQGQKQQVKGRMI